MQTEIGIGGSHEPTDKTLLPAGFSLSVFCSRHIYRRQNESYFYRALLKRANNLTPTEKIVYSFLVSKSVSSIDCIFESDGVTINKDILDCWFNGEQWSWFDLNKINNSKLSRELHITRMTAIKCVSKLEQLRFIKYDFDNDCWLIYINREMLDGGYFELQNIDAIGGDLVVFYSYLRNKGEKYGYNIDTFKSRLADDLGKTKIAITKMLNRLYKLGLAERLHDGKLLIK